MAQAVELGVDILEAGFPPDGDFEAVDAVSREFPWAQVAALARSCTGRRARRQSLARPPARIHTLSLPAHPLKYKLKKAGSRCSKRRSPRWNWPGPRG
jgi:isopropylmalate/homocitrate/citramalate synthase